MDTWFFNFLALNIIWNKKSFAIFHRNFRKFSDSSKELFITFFFRTKFFRKDAKSTRYFVCNHEGESCLIWTRFIYHLLYYVLTTENSVKQRGTYHDKIHRLDTSIINKVSLKTTDLQEQMNWDKLNNWVLERKTQIIGIDRLE